MNYPTKQKRAAPAGSDPARKWLPSVPSFCAQSPQSPVLALLCDLVSG